MKGAYYGHEEVVKELMLNGADLKIRNDVSDSELLLTIAVKYPKKKNYYYLYNNWLIRNLWVLPAIEYTVNSILPVL